MKKIPHHLQEQPHHCFRGAEPVNTKRSQMQSNGCVCALPCPLRIPGASGSPGHAGTPPSAIPTSAPPGVGAFVHALVIVGFFHLVISALAVARPGSQCSPASSATSRAVTTATRTASPGCFPSSTGSARARDASWTPPPCAVDNNVHQLHTHVRCTCSTASLLCCPLPGPADPDTGSGVLKSTAKLDKFVAHALADTADHVKTGDDEPWIAVSDAVTAFLAPRPPLAPPT